MNANETLREPEVGGEGLKLDPFTGTDDPTKALYRLLAVPSLRARYLGYIHDIAENWLDWRKMGPMVREYQALISADVKTDTHKLYTFGEFTEGTTGVVEASSFGGFMAPAAYSLRSFMEQRRPYLLNYVEPPATPTPNRDQRERRPTSPPSPLP